MKSGKSFQVEMTQENLDVVLNKMYTDRVVIHLDTVGGATMNIKATEIEAIQEKPNYNNPVDSNDTK